MNQTPLPEMPGVADTGTVIGTLRPQPPLEPSPVAVPPEEGAGGDDGNDAADPMEVDAAADEGDALQAVEKLRSDDAPSRVEAARKLASIAAALGPRRTRDELLPFLSDGVDDEDEVLEAVAASLGNLVPHVGGREHAAALLAPLELLLAVEESVVRERAAASAIKVSRAVEDDGARYASEFVGMIGRLATKEWFTARISACGLIPVAFARMSPGLRSTHLEHFANLCRDDAPMVRRIASRNLGSLLYTVVETMGPTSLIDGEDGGVVSTTLLDLYESLAGGDQPDSVRLHTTQNCVSFGKAMTLIKENASRGGGEESEILAQVDVLVKRILPLIVATIDDRSWRVRWTAASKFAGVVHAFSPLDGTMDALVPAYEKLLQDPEAEVRTAATYNLSEVAKADSLVRPGSPGDEGQRVPVAQRLVQRVASLTEDDSENVRAALGVVATELAPALGKDATLAHLLPPMLLLLRDASSEVRLNVVSSLSRLNDVIGAEMLTQSLLPTILDLAEDGKWRIRLAVIERIPLLARQLGREFFTDRLLSLCVGWLGDDISSIREAAAKDLEELTSLLGSEWSRRNLLPRVRQVMEHPSYLRRTNGARALARMALAMDTRDAQWEVLPALLEAYCDPVPNVRFNVAKGLGAIGPRFGRSVYEGQIAPILELMKEDQDRDVRFFAGLSSDSLGAHFDSKPAQ